MYNRYFQENIDNSKRVWKGIKKLVHFKQKTIVRL